MHINKLFWFPFFPLLIGLAIWGPNWLRRLALISVLGLLTLIPLVITTGVFRLLVDADLIVELHRWGGHGILLWAWPMTGIVLIFAIEQIIRELRWRRGIVLIVLQTATLAFALLASITGYLGPSHGPANTLALQRFQLFHFLVFPTLLTLVSIGSWLSLRSKPWRANPPSTTGKFKENQSWENENNGNPYQSP